MTTWSPRSATSSPARIDGAEALGIPRDADRDRPGHRLRQDVRPQPGTLAEPRSICQPGMCRPGRHLAQGVPRHVDRPAGRPSGRRPRSSRRWRPSSRGANVVRVHDVGPMVDAIKVWTAMHGWDEIADEPGDRDATTRNGPACTRMPRPWPSRAKAAVAGAGDRPGAAKDAWLRRSAEAIRRAVRRDPRGQRARRRRRPGLRPERRGDRPADARTRSGSTRSPRPCSRSPPCPTRSARSSRRAAGPTGWTSPRSASPWA